MRFNTSGFNPSDEQNQPEQPKRVAIPVDIKVFSDSLQAFQEKIADLRKEFQSLFQEQVKVLFGAVPDLEGIAIIQYTPYFNDGDTCEFSVSSVSFYNEDFDEDNYESDFSSPPEQKILKDSLKSFIYNNEELMKSLYGDHAKVIITREETKVEIYDHE